ncbi:MAG: hypothetical protein ACOYOZ_07550, partial [Pirellula sp.]
MNIKMDARSAFFKKVIFDMSFIGFTSRRRVELKPACRLAMSLAMLYVMFFGAVVHGAPIAKGYALSQDPNELNPGQGDPNAPSPPNGPPGAGAPGSGATGAGAPGAGAPKDTSTLKRPTEPKQAP